MAKAKASFNLAWTLPSNAVLARDERSSSDPWFVGDDQ